MKTKYLKIFLLPATAIFIYAFYFYAFPEHFKEFPINWKHMGFDIISLSLMAWVIYKLNVWINKKTNKYAKWEDQPIKRLFYQIAGSTFATFAFVSVAFPLNLLITYYLNPEVFKSEVFSEAEIFINSIGYIFLLIFFFFQAVFISIYFYKNWVKSLLEAEKLKEEKIHSQLHALQNQTNPHFLFNSLNTLTALIEEDKETATEFVQQLASFYRYLLQMQDDHLIKLGEELNFINAYIFLQSKRFGSNLKVEIKINKESFNKYIPTFIIQILLENAIKHNVVSHESPLTIEIYSIDNHTLIIKNNIQKKLTPPPSSGYGLNNIRNRYSILADKNISIKNDEHTFEVTVPLFDEKTPYEMLNN